VAWIARGDTSSEGAGLGLLRKVAVERVLSPDGVRVGVSYTEIGIELAQVALGFGASELRGVLANKRGLPIADDATKRVKGQGQVSAQLLQRKELSEVLAYVGRRAVFAEGDTPAEISGGETHA
jgi:2-iminoacetate synthase ThiH